jgi:hypothetical protein
MIKTLLLVLLLLTAMVPAVAGRASDDADVRAAVQRSFQLLKDGQYSALYDALPSSAKKSITRQKFVQSMQQSRGLYRVDRMDIGTVKVSGNTATADTTMYGRVLKPQENDGKIVVRQRLVRESGVWHLAVNNTSPRIYVKRDGRWVDVTALLNSNRKRK